MKASRIHIATVCVDPRIGSIPPKNKRRKLGRAEHRISDLLGMGPSLENNEPAVTIRCTSQNSNFSANWIDRGPPT